MIRLVNLLKEASEAPITYAMAAQPVLNKLLADRDVRMTFVEAADMAGNFYKGDLRFAFDDISFNPKNIQKADPVVMGRVIEETLRIILSDWQDDSTNANADMLMKFSPLFIEMSKSMKSINPTQDTAFRGTKIDDTKLKALVKKSKPADWKVVKNISDIPYVQYIGPKKNAFVYKPKRNVQSWSVRAKSASRFGNVVISTDLDNTFFFTPEFLYNLTGTFKHEKETIHFGKYPMNVTLYIPKNVYNDYSGVSLKRSMSDYLKEKISESESDEEGTLDLPF